MKYNRPKSIHGEDKSIEMRVSLPYFSFVSKLLLWGILLVSYSLSAQTQATLSAQEWLQQRGEVYCAIPLPIEAELQRGLDSLTSVDKLQNDQLLLYANEAGYAFLKSNQIAHEVLLPPSLQHSEESLLRAPSSNWDFYPSLQAYYEMMQEFAFEYPELCRLDTMGYSEENRPILYLIISTDLDETLSLPGVYLTSTMHGDETLGYPLLLRLADYLLSSYGSNAKITQLIEKTHIYLNPLANPDGTYAVSENSVFGATRFNANQLDLNRNFPDPSVGNHPDGNPWQSENLAQMNMHQKHRIHLSGNIHGGFEVLNYPWDTWSHPHPDDDFFIFLSREYVDTAHLYTQPDLGNYLSSFNNGITNGYSWYYITGSRQDYVTYFTGGREVTLELSNNKMPAPGLLPLYWEASYRSLLNYIDRSHYGIHGFVKDAETQLPLRAKIELLVHDFDQSFVYSDSLKGDFYRFVSPGVYQLQVSAPGYQTQELFVNLQDYYTTEEVDIDLQPLLNAHDHRSKPLQLYPNPCSEILYIESAQAIDEVQVFNLKGQLLETHPLYQQNSIPVGNLPAGVYILKSASDATFHRFVKQ